VTIEGMSEDATQRCSACGASVDSNCLLRAENNLLRTKFDILLDKVSISSIYAPIQCLFAKSIIVIPAPPIQLQFLTLLCITNVCIGRPTSTISIIDHLHSPCRQPTNRTRQSVHHESGRNNQTTQ